MSLLVPILLLLVVWLGWRLRTTRRLVGQIVEAAEKTEPVLLESSNPWIRGSRLDRLVRVYNQLLAENAKITGTGEEYHNQIQAMLGNLREAVVMVDRDNVIFSANPAFLDLAGQTESPYSKRLDLYIQGPAFRQLLQEVQRDGSGQRQEIAVQIANREYWLEISAAPLRDPGGGNPRFTLFVFHNITRQKKLEKMRTEFVANVSHELRTPVTIIKGFTETLIEDDAVLSAEERVRFLHKIRSNSERLHSLLEDLLLLSRLESTEMVLRREVISLSAFLRELADSFRADLEADGKSLVLDLDAGDDRLEADPLRLSQVVTNLVENAIKHAKGFTEIRIRTWRDRKGVHLVVADNGSGIPEKDLKHIFQRFYRVEKGRSRESGGTGLGLSIVKHIVGQHGGEVMARSAKGEGTEIEIVLPAPEEASRPETQGGQ